MKSYKLPLLAFSTIAVLGLSFAGDKYAIAPFDYKGRTPLPGLRTERDLPGTYSKYYGQRRNQYRDIERQLAKVDLDADLNYDGTITNSDPADGGAFEHTPPGLVVGVGEMTKVISRIRPYRVDFEGQAVVTIEVLGINRAVRSGRFESLEEEAAATGRIRIYKDAGKKECIIDSADPNKRSIVWSIDSEKYPPNLPGIYPRVLYIEGVKPSGKFPGDIRVLLTVSHRIEKEVKSDLAYKLRPKRFRTAYDHILLTVSPEPHQKDFVNANAEKVWLSAGEKDWSK